jgi:hypothetical protein
MLNSFEVRKSIYARLDAQLTTPVYSFVPQNSAYPYVRIGDVSSVTQDTKTTEMQEYTVTIHSFDKSVASSSPIEAIAANIYTALHNYALSVTGYNVVLCRQENLTIIQQGEPNDRYWHAIQDYRLIVEDV